MSLDDKFGILVRKSKKNCASRGFRYLSGLFLVKIFQKLEFKKKFGLRLGKILEFSQFLEFKMP